MSPVHHHPIVHDPLDGLRSVNGLQTVHVLPERVMDGSIGQGNPMDFTGSYICNFTLDSQPGCFYTLFSDVMLIVTGV